MGALSWSGWAPGACSAALPSARASAAGESALAAAAWLVSGEESRFSTRRILLCGDACDRGVRRPLAVWLARHPLLVVALKRGFVGRVGAAQWLALGDLAGDPGFQLL